MKWALLIIMHDYGKEVAGMLSKIEGIQLPLRQVTFIPFTDKEEIKTNFE